MDYPDALAWLDRHRNREATAGRIDDLTLAPIEALLGVLGDPHLAYPSIHITGTNGKGSVARMVTSLLRAHGLGVGTATSPHLQRVNERICIDGEPISDEGFAQVIGEIAAVAPMAGVELSWFELTTAAAFSWFATQAVDVAVVEVGLLGRYDATNVVRSPVAVVTNIGYDHTDGEGDWRAAIAWEKVGIVKEDSFLVLGETDPALRSIFTDAAGEQLWVLDEDLGVVAQRPAIGGQVLDLRTPAGEIDDVFLPAFGDHQGTNAALALAAAEAFFGRPCDPDVAREAFAAVRMPGCLEVAHRQPLVVLDSAHNPPGAAAASHAFTEDFAVDGRRFLVVGLLEGRDPRTMLEALCAGGIDGVIACRAPSPRAVEPELLAEAGRALGLPVEVVPEVERAVSRALAVAEDPDAILVAGSLTVVGAARSAPALVSHDDE
ncbi:MAG: bifunctional folylpolyglutamate synthase/dihydrofolate synthase [Acidimicrobiia bacterium]|nr:bifunctional folylpolyglutamate synthase/dihydrofolate synthase [Acidimicrobiia bacterium]